MLRVAAAVRRAQAGWQHGALLQPLRNAARLASRFLASSAAPPPPPPPPPASASPPVPPPAGDVQALAARASRVRTQADALAWLDAAASALGWSRGAAAWRSHAAARQAQAPVRRGGGGAPAPSPAPPLPPAAAAALRAPLCSLLRRFAALPSGHAGGGGGVGGAPPLLAPLFAGARLMRAALPAGVRWRYQHPHRAEAAALHHAVIGGDAELRAWGQAAAARRRPVPAPSARLEALVDLLQAVADVAHFSPAVGVAVQAIDAALVVAVREGALADATPRARLALAHGIFAAHEVLSIACPSLWHALQAPLLSLLQPLPSEGWLAAGGAADGEQLQRLAALAFCMSRTGGLDPQFAAALLRALAPRLAAAASMRAPAVAAAALADAARRTLQTLVNDGTPVGMLPAAELADVFAATAAACEAQARAAAARRRAAAAAAAAGTGGAAASGAPGGVLVSGPSREAREALALIHALCASGVPLPLPLPQMTAAGRALVLAELQPLAQWRAADVGALAAAAAAAAPAAAGRDRAAAHLLRALQMLHQLVLWAAAHDGALAELLPAWLPPLTTEAVRLADSRAPGGGGARSAFEALATRLVAELCARRGLPAPEENYHVASLGITVDLAWPSACVAVEADGPFHFSPRPPAEHAAVLAHARGSAWDPATPEASPAWVVARSPRGPCELWHVTSEVYHPRMLLRHRALTAAGWAVARVRHFDLFQPPPPAVAPALAAAPSGGGGRDVARRGPFQGGARAPPHTAMLAHEDEGLAIIDRLLSAAGVWRRLEASEASRAALPSLRSQLSASSL